MPTANLKSAFLTYKHVVPIMERQGGGSVVNISSIAGLRYIGKPQVAYAAAKAALLQMTQTTAVIYAAKGIRLNCVVPGLMFTPLVKRLADNTLRVITRASWRTGTSRYRWGAWATRGTWRTRCFFLPATRADTSRRSRSSWTAG